MAAAELRRGDWRYQYQRVVGNGRRAARAPRGSRTDPWPRQRRYLRRRDAVQAERDRGLLRRPLLPDHQQRARLPGLVEAGLFEGRRMARRGRLRGPVACRRSQRAVERGGSPRAAGPAAAGARPARGDARERHPRFGADRHGGRRLGAPRMDRLARQPRARPDRVPVRHAAAADAGKPDPAGVEGPADDA